MLLKLIVSAALALALGVGGSVYLHGAAQSSLQHAGANKSAKATKSRSGASVRTGSQAQVETATVVRSRASLRPTSGVSGKVSVVPCIVTSVQGGQVTLAPISASAWARAQLPISASLSLPFHVGASAGSKVDSSLSAGTHVLALVKDGSVTTLQVTSR